MHTSKWYSAAGSLSRRAFLRSSAAVGSSLGAIRAVRAAPRTDFALAFDLLDAVVPNSGVRTETRFADVLQKLIAAGVIDPAKYRAIYGGAVPAWVERLLSAPSSEPIVFSRQTAPYLLNLLWPVGLATRTKFNLAGPLNSSDMPNFASTAGWKLGKAPSGAVYFNKVQCLQLTNEQDARTYVVASNAFRPCCDNSTLFQDCNHGSALLGLMVLSASQGADERTLYWLGKVANSYWFPEYYVRTAVHFAQAEKRTWDEVGPQRLLSKEFSSQSGWTRNVYGPQQRSSTKGPTDLLASPNC